MLLGFSKEDLADKGGLNTATEINQQPKVWEKVFQRLLKEEKQIQVFLEKVYANTDYQIILTGAGTSEFVGNTVVSYLKNIHSDILSIPTTDLVSSPEKYFSKQKVTLLVSMARSGNSPESLAAVELANQFVPQIYHLGITCNREGKLAQFLNNKENAFIIHMPEETNDKGFAMTSSFSSVLLSTYIALSKEVFATYQSDVEAIVRDGQFVQKEYVSLIQSLAKTPFDRIIYLGSNGLKAIAQESALKILELTSGKITTLFDTPLGFRHGPKSYVNNKTLTIVYFSNVPYTKQYEIDLLKEIYNDNRGNTVVALTQEADEQIRENTHFMIHLDSKTKEFHSDFFLAFGYIVFAQSLALTKSLSLDITPDVPCADGTVNRVVQGVKIYNYGEQ